ncbi:hypothetical protein ACG1BZ_14930 [Microbulbifer sp. CNSA002]|uniref:hypothetical protein n=1 Tax=Microbulbifer sp. CNSA002 TaxID=3373604 RepID=UPI0039B5F4EF
MKPTEFWKNFKLGEELCISGTFIYNGLRCFHEMDSLDRPEELFEFLYNLSVGFERLLKIAIVLHEHNDTVNQEALEKSLITHNHSSLLKHLQKHSKINLSSPQIHLFDLLSIFYKSLRYDRFTLSSSYQLNKERESLFNWLNKHLNTNLLNETPLLGNINSDRYRKFVQKTTLKISKVIYEIIKKQACKINLYTYELRSGSKAESIFLREVKISEEDILWKELLIFFMNTDSSSGYLNFLKGIQPLEFDPGLISDYLECFQSNKSKASVMDELEHLYSETVSNVKERLEEIGAIAAPNIYFETEDDDPEEEYTDLHLFD